MSQPGDWFKGLVLIALLLAAAVVTRQTAMESALGQSATADLAASGLPFARVSMVGRDATLTGEAPEPGLRQLALAAAARVFGVRQVADGMSVLPEAKPFTLSAVLAENSLTLSGFAPSEAARKALLDAAKAAFPGVSILDQLKIARGAPQGDWRGMLRLAFSQLAQLAKGSASLSDSALTLTGTGKLGITEESVRAGLKTLPAGFTLEKLAIEPGVIRPYLFSATRGEGALTLSGFVPDAKTRADILDLAKRFFEGDAVKDSLVEGPGAPANFLAMIKAGLPSLARLVPGAALSLSDRSISLKGLALYDGARDEVAGEARRLLPTGAIELATAPLPPPLTDAGECQGLYQAALARATLRFRTGSADLSAESLGLLDKLIVVTLRCTEARVEIGGHTDTDGSPQANADLSRRRAETVGAYLLRAGIPAERLEAVGYGETSPVAPNDTAENKAKNRRITFIVKESIL